MFEDDNSEDQQGRGIVYVTGALLFFLSAVAFFMNLQWVWLLAQRTILKGIQPEDIREYLEALKTLEEGVPFFHLWIYYGLAFNAALIVTCCGLLRFNEKARVILRYLLAFDAMTFLALAIYYYATGYEPRMVEDFHTRFIVAVSRIVLMLFLGSKPFMNAFRKGRPKIRGVSNHHDF